VAFETTSDGDEVSERKRRTSAERDVSGSAEGGWSADEKISGGEAEGEERVDE